MKLGGIYLSVGAKTDQLKRDLTKAKTLTGKAVVHMKNALDKINFRRLGIAATAFAGVTVLALKKVTDAAKEQEAVEKRLESVLISTGHAAGYNLDQLKTMASEMQKVTTVGDELILKNMAVLATFKQIRGEGFERATQAALDMAEVMQQDVQSAIVMIGKALNDPIANLSAMSRAGVQFTKDQKEMVKELWNSGKAAEAQDIILKELESQFGGAAKAARETFGGALKSAGNALGDMHEQIGFAITKNETLIELVHDAEKAFISAGEAIGEWVNQNDELIAQKTHEAIKSITESVKSIVSTYNSIPDDVKGAAGIGVIGSLLFGKKGGVLIGSSVFLINELRDAAEGLQGVIDGHISLAEAIGDEREFEAALDRYRMFKKRIEEEPTRYGVVIAPGTLEALYNKQNKTKPPNTPQPLQPAPEPLPALTEMLPFSGQLSELNTFFDEYESFLERKSQMEKEFNQAYSDLGKSQYDMERDQIQAQADAWAEYNVDKVKLAEWTAEKLEAIKKAEVEATIATIGEQTGAMADNFKEIAEMGGRYSKETFDAYKAFKIVETIIATRDAAMKAYGSLVGIPYVGPTLAVGAATAAIAFGSAQVATISAAQPPSYDTGGISNAGGIYRTGNIREAHVPIPSGKIPVEMGEQKAPEVRVDIANIVSPDLFDSYISTARGKNAQLNFISANAGSIKRILRSN